MNVDFVCIFKCKQATDEKRARSKTCNDDDVNSTSKGYVRNSVSVNLNRFPSLTIYTDSVWKNIAYFKYKEMDVI